MEKLEARSNQVITNIIDPQQRIESDLNICFPVTYRRGKKYLFVLYKNDISSIPVRPMKVRTDK